MAGKDDIETASQPGVAPERAAEIADTARRAARSGSARLAGFAFRLADKLVSESETFLTTPAEGEALLKTAQTIAGLARASVAVHKAQGEEDKAGERLEARTEAQEIAKTRARVRQAFHPDEDEDTDMNERDPRLDDPQAMAEVRGEVRDQLGALALDIKSRGGALRPLGRGLPRDAGELAAQEPRRTAAAA